jgi:hypothetical protein
MPIGAHGDCSRIDCSSYPIISDRGAHCSRCYKNADTRTVISRISENAGNGYESPLLWLAPEWHSFGFSKQFQKLDFVHSDRITKRFS